MARLAGMFTTEPLNNEENDFQPQLQEAFVLFPVSWLMFGMPGSMQHGCPAGFCIKPYPNSQMI